MVRVETPRPLQVLCHERAGRLVDFLEMSGGCEYAAARRLGIRKVEEAAEVARRTGYMVRAWSGRVTLWLPREHRVIDEYSFRCQRVLGMFAAHLVAQGGQVVSNDDGEVEAVFPGGQRFSVSVAPDRVECGGWVWRWDELQRAQNLRSAAKKRV